jgi:hypothetical protein
VRLRPASHTPQMLDRPSRHRPKPRVPLPLPVCPNCSEVPITAQQKIPACPPQRKNSFNSA